MDKSEDKKIVEPIVITGGKDESSNVGILIERSHFDGKNDWKNPVVRNALPAMLGSHNPPRTGIVGKTLRMLDGPRRHRVTRGSISYSRTHAELKQPGRIPPEAERRTLVLKPRPAKSRRDNLFRQSVFELKGKLEHSALPVVGKDIAMVDDQSIVWGLDSLALHAPRAGSPFHSALGALNRALQHKPDKLLDEFHTHPWRSGALCVPTRVYPLPWRSGKDAGIPVFRRSRLQVEGFLLAVHHAIPQDMLEDIWEARLLEAKIQDCLKGEIVREQVARMEKARLASKITPFGLEYLEKTNSRRPQSAYPWGYYIETDGVAVVRTVEEAEAMLLADIDLDWLEQVTNPGYLHKFGEILFSHGEEIAEPARPVSEPIVLPQVISAPAFTSLSEVRMWEVEKTATG